MDPMSPIMFLAEYALASAKTPSRNLRSTTPSSAKSFKSSKSAGSRSAKSAKSSVSAITTKSNLIERGACQGHFSGCRGKPSNQSIADAMNCINGKCGAAKTIGSAMKPTIKPTIKLTATKAAKALSKSKMAKIALAEVIVQKARLVLFEAKAALAVAEKDLEKIMLN